MNLPRKQIYNKINLLQQKLNNLLCSSHILTEEVLIASREIDELVYKWYSQAD